MNKFQNDSHDDGFYYQWDLQLDPRYENKITIDTSCVEPCMVPPLEYFQISSDSNDGDFSLFYCPAPLSPASASVESLFSFSLDTPYPVTGPQTMLLPSPDGNSSASSSLSFSTQDYELHFDLHPPLPCTVYPGITLQSWSFPSGVYDSSAYTSGSKRPNDHAPEQVIKIKPVMNPKEHTSSFKKSPRVLKPFVCKVCSRPFARKHDLQRHIRVHTGFKPYSCLHCKKAFVRTDALKHHLRVVEACRSSPVIQAMKESGDRRYRNL